ncbi:MAG: type II toxin-antitoxin system prevent-host-death family antitoxin [Nitrospirota bacterium]
MKATAKDLRFHTSELLDTVNRGEEVIITYRGRPCAKLVPIEQGSRTIKEKKENELFGIWKDNPDVKDVQKYIRKLRKRRFKDAG